MDAKKIIDRINNPAELQNDDAKEWKELTEKHPYFSVGQLLQYGNDYFQEKDNVEFTVIYKADPILFAHFANEIKSTEKKELKKSKQENKTIETELNLPMADTKETPIVIAENVKEEVLVENKKESIGLKEDILAMINELPNRNIIEEKIVKSEPIIETIESENISEEEKRQKALMVMMSFSDWLNHFKSKTEKEQIEEQEKRALKTAWQKEKLTAIIEEEQDEIPEMIFKQAMDSISMENALISESLAEILAKQGKTDKAIEMYKKLSLRNPEKNSYFADRIKDLLTNNI
jgi:tetratricopeptide (TPR) repeat protein